MEDAVRLRLQYALVMAFVDHHVRGTQHLPVCKDAVPMKKRPEKKGVLDQAVDSSQTSVWSLRSATCRTRNEDQAAFKTFMRMPPEMYDEILARVEHRIQKQYTWFRKPLPPGLKLSTTLRHLASGAKYADMQFAWRVPENTLSVVVREVCQAICDEYAAEVMTPPTAPMQCTVAPHHRAENTEKKKNKKQKTYQFTTEVINADIL